MPTGHFFAWAALGSVGLMVIHDAFFGGRDWDLLSFPGLFCTLWGLSALTSLARHRQRRSALLPWGVLPLMALHTSLWIGINADGERGIARMEHLLRYTANQPLHYQYYYRGYYYMNIRHQPQRAAPMFREAAAFAPPGQMAPEGVTYRSRYLRMLGYTLADMNQLEEAITVFAEAYPADELPIFSQKGPDFHYRWILTHMRLGEKHYDNGEVEIADGLWAQAVAYGRHISIRQPNTRIQHLVGIGLQAMGRYEEAIDIIEESLLREDDPAHERELRQALDKLYTLRKEAP